MQQKESFCLLKEWTTPCARSAIPVANEGGVVPDEFECCYDIANFP
jgi:hypothetical protein